MSRTITIRRVTIILDTVLKRRVLEACFKLGAKGYTSMECHGQGRHPLLEDPYTGEALVRLEFLVQPQVAEKIIDYMHDEVFSQFAATVCSEAVEVCSSDSF